ncbi:MAG TPA: MgtC/SapB family protein [Vicinamibacterales bacterium]|nr:MgtC/SapB family protein [Vicinamibacterales bacterium]
MTTQDLIPLAIAALGGAVVGLERQWSGHADGPRAHFGGIRTFTLLGLLGGIAGQLAASAPLLAAALAAGGVGLVVAAYAAASRIDIDGTTEAAALLVIAAGALAGSGRIGLASGLAATTGLLLVEKSRLHALAAHIDGVDLRAGIRFAAMAIVVLPLVPAGPFGPGIGVRPRELWALVLFFSGLSFAGHVARKALGLRHGLTVAGAIGGLISSTNVTLTFARSSRDEPALGRALGVGAVAANLVLVPRVLVATAVLNVALLPVLLPWLLAPLAVAVAFVAWGLRDATTPATTRPASDNPLRIAAALQMAVLFQIVLFGVDAAQTWFGRTGLLASAAALGLTDVDALTVTMARGMAARAGLDAAARAIAVGVFTNTVLKAAIAVTVGRGAFRGVAGAALTAMALALAATLAWW